MLIGDPNAQGKTGMYNARPHPLSVA